LYVVINTDSRFVVPNRQLRIGERTDAVRPRSAALRSQFGGRPLLLTRPATVNWITGGLSDPIDLTAGSDPVWVIETESGRTLITNQIEAPRLASDFDLAGLGWNIIGVPWFDAGAPLDAALDFCGEACENLLSDRADVGLDISSDVVAERMVLSESDRDDLRALSALVGHALGAGIDAWRPGVSTDFDVAAVISAELERHGAKAVCLIVGGDDRLRELRHPLAIGATMHDAVMAVVVARRAGLHAAATRIAVRRGDDPIVALVDELDAVNRDVLAASLPGGTWGGAVEALAAGYESIGRPGSWREHFQGGPIAFEQREFELAPGQSDSPFWNLACLEGTAVAWNPSARGGAKIEETYLLDSNGLELLTATDGWPLTPQGAGPRHSRVRVIE
jgi:Xaa-Pro dipeptidase